jgi:hypothetical protein
MRIPVYDRTRPEPTSALMTMMIIVNCHEVTQDRFQWRTFNNALKSLVFITTENTSSGLISVSQLLERVLLVALDGRQSGTSGLQNTNFHYYCDVLGWSPRHGASLDCGWRRRPPVMEGSCEYLSI